MADWINWAYNCDIPQFVKCAKTMMNWLTGILNSFTTTITNGFTEGCNNKIKVLKRNAYGFRNFKRFFAIVFYICLPINQKNKRQFNFLPLVKYLYFIFRITPTIDKKNHFLI